MFPPETPPPSKYRSVKQQTTTPVFKPNVKEETTPLWIRTLQIFFVLAGIGVIGWILFSAPEEGKLVCDKSKLLGRNSLISFGSCTKE